MTQEKTHTKLALIFTSQLVPFDSEDFEPTYESLLLGFPNDNGRGYQYVPLEEKGWGLRPGDCVEVVMNDRAEILRFEKRL